MVRRPEIAVIGGYHYGNTGDILLGQTTARRIGGFGKSAGLQTIYSLDRWPAVSRAVVGGGAVGSHLGIRQLAARYGKSPENVAMLGIDFEIWQFDESTLEFLSRVGSITCRSEEQATEIRRILGRMDVRAHPDLAFLGAPFAGSRQPRSGTLGINVAPFLVDRATGPGFRFTDCESMPLNVIEGPEGEREKNVVGPKYREWMRGLVTAAVRDGRRVQHIPLTLADHVYARQFLSDLEIEFLPYLASPKVTFDRMCRVDRFVSSRFHAAVMAILSGTPLTPFAYAPKALRMAAQLPAGSASWVRPSDLLSDSVTAIGRALTQDSPLLTRSQTVALGRTVADTVDPLLAKLVNA